MDSEEIDLANVDYEDVLNLYRGWRRSESALKEKNKEVNSLRERMKHLQDSHVKFRSQIQALESVKELTISLQTQLSILQQENNQLNQDNRRLTEQNRQANELVAARTASETETSKILKDLQLDFASLRTKYSDLSYAQRNLEAVNADEQAMRMAAEARVQANQDVIDGLRREIKEQKLKLETSASRMVECDLELTHASDQLKNLAIEVSNIAESHRKANSAEAEVSILKGDIARLLRLLEHYPAAKKFVRHWQDSQGMNFVGMSSEGDDEIDDILSKSGNRSYHGDGIDDNDFAAGWAEVGLTPGDLDHLKRVHGGGDLFPMTNNIDDEIELWVPANASAQGLKFWSSKLPHTSRTVIMDFLRSMNKVWLRRERRKIRRVKEVYDQSIGDLKRQLAHAKPYQGVIAERQIRRLKSQVLEKTKKQLTGKPRNRLEMSAEELLEDLDSDEEAARQMSLPPHHRRPCQQHHGRLDDHSSLHASGSSSLRDISAKKFLEVTLNTLESLGRQDLSGSGINVSTATSAGTGGFRSTDRQNASSPGFGLSSNGGEDGKSTHPSETFLRGALWMGRNLTMITEEMWEEMDEFRTKHLSDIAGAVQDPDPRRGCHRLNLLAGSGINQSLALVNNGKKKAREILKGVSGLSPGDYNAFRALARSLPIEAALAASSPSPTGHSSPSEAREYLSPQVHGHSSTHSHMNSQYQSHSRSLTPNGQPLTPGAIATPQSARNLSHISHISNFSRS